MHEKTKLDFSRIALASGKELEPTNYPLLDNISPGFLFKFVPRIKKLSPPEFAYIPLFYKKRIRGDYSVKAILTITQWNALWELGQFRPEMCPQLLRHDFPDGLSWLRKYKDANLYLIPNARKAKYDSFVPLYHLIPLRTLRKYSLPAFKRGFWPFWTVDWTLDQFIGDNFDDSLSDAFAYHIWPYIDSGSKIAAFSKDYPLKLLAHNLDFWLPYTVQVIEKHLKRFPFIDFDEERRRDELDSIQKEMPSNIYASRPRRGGPIWIGEHEAWEVTKEVIENADRRGKLRAIIEAVRSNHIEDDFSEKWSYAKEDFERKIYHKRSKIKVTFVEMKDTIPVHGPESEVDESLIWENLFALLSPKEKHITICLRNGITRVGDIAKRLGYANHSPVSKALSKIRIKAKTYLNC